MRPRWWAGWRENAIQQSEEMPRVRACDEEERADRQGRPAGEMPGLPVELNDAAAAGLIASLANSIATFGMVGDMNRRGKVVNIAFAVSAAFVFGDHLGFTAGFAPEMIGPMIVGKLVGGVSAIAVAMWLTGKEEKS